MTTLVEDVGMAMTLPLAIHFMAWAYRFISMIISAVH